jgi:hypothetical protein
MSTTRDWMHGGEDPPEPVRQRLPIGMITLWALGLVFVANAGIVVYNLLG